LPCLFARSLLAPFPLPSLVLAFAFALAVLGPAMSSAAADLKKLDQEHTQREQISDLYAKKIGGGESHTDTLEWGPDRGSKRTAVQWLTGSCVVLAFRVPTAESATDAAGDEYMRKAAKKKEKWCAHTSTLLR